ncbi:hypothetical protein GEMRC1_010312 [Eukaryota sp. GEM-RC1]
MILGFDLGLSHLYCASLKNNSASLVLNSYSKPATPCYVSIRGILSVGISAKNNQETNPQSTIYELKNLIGITPKELKKLSTRLPFKVIHKDKQIFVETEHASETTTTSLADIIGHLVSYVKQCAEQSSKQSFSTAVIAVPPSFSSSQISLLSSSFSSFATVETIPEPVAAITASSLSSSQDDVIVVHAGGRSLDLSHCVFKSNQYTVKNYKHYLDLSGDAFLDSLVHHCVSSFNHAHPDVDLSSHLGALASLRKGCEGLLKEMKNVDDTVVFDFGMDLVRNKGFSFEVSLDFMRNLFSELLDSVSGCFESFFKKYKLSPNIQILLEGGFSTFILFQEVVRKFSTNVMIPSNPEEIVAKGAVLHASRHHMPRVQLETSPNVQQIEPKAEPSQVSRVSDVFVQKKEVPEPKPVVSTPPSVPDAPSDLNLIPKSEVSSQLLELMVNPPDLLDGSKLESYLSDEKFTELVGMSRDEFYSLKGWKQKQLKKK